MNTAPVVTAEEWTQTPDSTKGLVSALQQRIAALEQRQPGSEDDGRITPQYVLRVIRKRWRMIVLIFFCIVVTFTILALIRSPVYTSTSVLLVKFGREFVYRAEIGERAVLINRDQQTIINAEVEILRSRSLVESVVHTLGAEALYPDLVAEPSTPWPPLATAVELFRTAVGLLRSYFSGSEAEPSTPRPLQDRAVELFRSDFSVQLVPETGVIRVSFRHEKPRMAAKAVNLAVDLFKEKHLRAFGDPQITAFLEEKVTAYRDNLEQSEEKIKTFLAENKAFSLKDRGELLLRQREVLEAALNETRNQIVGLRQKLLFLKPEKEAITKNVALYTDAQQNQVVAAAQARLLELQLAEQKLLGKFQEMNPQVIDIRKQIHLAKNFLAEQEAKTGASRFYQELDMEVIKTQAELHFQEARSANLTQQLNQLDMELQSFLLQEAKARDLIRERDTSEENYRTYLKRLEEARISEEMDRQKIANISVIQEGLVPFTPTGLGKKAMLAIGMLVGTAIGLGAAFAVEAVGRQGLP